MRLSVPYRILDDIFPEPELMAFDFDTIQVDPSNKYVQALRTMFRPFGEMLNFPILRSNNWENIGQEGPRMFPNIDHPVTALVMREVEKLEKYYNAVAKLAVIDIMPPGTRILTHIDTNEFFHQCHRIHLPLETNPDVDFYIAEITYNFKAGTFFELDNSNSHGVLNRSTTERRLHLVVDLYPNSTG